jgi:hypothetical protein
VAAMTEVKKETYPTTDKQGGGLSLLLRLFWIAIGNFILFFIAFGIYDSEEKGLGLKDAIYWVVVMLLILTRYTDIRYLGGLTAQGTPASMTHWYRYAVGLPICAGLIWGLAHAANYFLP